jgi:lipoate-protein ligase B
MKSMKSVPKQDNNRLLQIRDCGIADYLQILQLQQHLRTQRQQNEIPNTVLIVEHPAVITLGARQSSNRLLVHREDLVQKHIDVVEVRRGGGTTAHNPGQLVFYPILDLQKAKLGINKYIRELEAIGAELLRQVNVHSTRRKGAPGLWVGERKIASIGVRVSKFITYHGMAINIQNDLSIFEYIVPCGLDNVEMTSVLKETGKEHPMNQIKQRLAKLLKEHFSPT